MPQVQFAGQRCELRENETVLDGLLRSGVPVAHACKAGSCGSCMLRAVEGVPPPRSQTGLKASWQTQGYFLSCICVPEADLTVGEVGSDARVPARITSIRRMTPDTVLVHIRAEAAFEFRAGQYLTLVRDNTLARSYSIASLPGEAEMELHIRLTPNGRMSEWLQTAEACDAAIQLQGPAGDCFYVPGREEQPILLLGTGTGLAPLYGIARDAIRSGHRGPIHLFHGAVREAGLYFRQELRDLAAAHDNFTYTATVLEGPESSDPVVGSLDAIVSSTYPKLTGWRAFVCGDPGLVRSLKRKLFLAGVAMGDIYSDAFLPSV